MPRWVTCSWRGRRREQGGASKGPVVEAFEIEIDIPPWWARPLGWPSCFRSCRPNADQLCNPPRPPQRPSVAAGQLSSNSTKTRQNSWARQAFPIFPTKPKINLTSGTRREEQLLRRACSTPTASRGVLTSKGAETADICAGAEMTAHLLLLSPSTTMGAAAAARASRAVCLATRQHVADGPVQSCTNPPAMSRQRLRMHIDLQPAP